MRIIDYVSDFLRRIALRWLRIEDYEIDGRMLREVMYAKELLEDMKHVQFGLQDSQMAELLSVQCRLDALCDALGVIVVEDATRIPQEAHIVMQSRPDSIMSEAKTYLDVLLQANIALKEATAKMRSMGEIILRHEREARKQ